ncbi:hypothetical protein Ancab_024616 [Ancistrocladus abbreviatus]
MYTLSLSPARMADFSLSHSQGLSHTSEEEEEELEQSPRQTTLITPVILPNKTTSGSSSKPRINSTQIAKTAFSPGADMSTLDCGGSGGGGRKPRGRPPGSKNKPKPPIYITRETEPSLKTLQLEISSGSDIVEMVQNFARKNQVGVNIINGLGSISDAVLKHPIHSQSITLSGTFDLLNVSGTFLGFSTCNSREKSSSGGSHSLAVFLGGTGGQVYGGIVMGKLVAASNVVLNASTFTNYEFHRLSAADFAEAADNNGNDVKPNFVVCPRTEASATTTAMSIAVFGGGGGGSGGPCPSPAPISSHAPEMLNWPPAPARPPHF